jgi:hypothetical protein
MSAVDRGANGEQTHLIDRAGVPEQIPATRPHEDSPISRGAWEKRSGQFHKGEGQIGPGHRLGPNLHHNLIPSNTREFPMQSITLSSFAGGRPNASSSEALQRLSCMNGSSPSPVGAASASSRVFWTARPVRRCNSTSSTATSMPTT